MANIPTDPSDDTDDQTPQAKARDAARKAAQAAAIVETYAAQVPVAASGGPVRAMPPAVATDLDTLKLRELVEVAAGSGDLKKPAAKAAIESALAVLGTALAQGREVNLPGLGKVKIKRSQLKNGQRITELRLRQKLDGEDGNQRVAEDAKGG
ncbi:HU family DNA-binding protein [Pseudooceanicola onchidii]|uniref:HU family DNA-binding protein n=1 Tax=Pseudooceanicola onchidii TaxID=2562279 RepID=UPI0010A9AF46|nr:HU family DNA-binding protein [Pseudooceanicola onchidii]